MNDNDTLNKIMNNINIVDLVSEFITLEKKGKNYIGLCPFHEDSNPSMSVSDEKQIFNCFSCNTGGNAITFYSKYKKISYIKTIEELANKYNIEFTSYKVKSKYNEKTQLLIDILNKTTLFYQNSLYTENGISCLEYLKKRNIDDKFISLHKIGFSTNRLKEYLLKDYDVSQIISAGLLDRNNNDFFKKRLIFPIENDYGDVVGFSGRTLSNSDIKYINSPGSLLFSKSKLLYNFSNAKEHIENKKEIIITEGFFDVIALEKIDIMNVVGLMGTTLTNHHLKILKNHTITLMLDSDKAGINSLNKVIEFLLQNNLIVNIIINDQKLDPDEYLVKFGKEKLLDLIKNKKDGFIYLLEVYKAKEKISNPVILNNILSRLIKYIPKNNETLYSIYKNHIAKIYNISIDIINDKFPHISKKFNNVDDNPYSNNTVHEQNINYFNILKWTLLNKKDYCKLYIKSNEILVDEKFISLRNIAKQNIANEKIIITKKKEFLEEIDHDVPNLISNKNEFFDIIEKLSIESLYNLEALLLEKLERIEYLPDGDNISIINLMSRIKNVKQKINKKKLERKDGKN